MESETAAPHTRRRTLLASGAVALLLATATPGAADPVRVEVVPQGDRARLTLTWPSPVGMRTEVRDGRLLLRFDRPIGMDLPGLGELREFIGSPSTANGRRTLGFPLQPGVTALAYGEGGVITIDFLRHGKPPGATAAAGDAPQAAAAFPAENTPQAVPTVGVRSGQHRGYSRIIFDWKQPVGYHLERADDDVVLVFDRPAEIDARQLQRPYLRYLRGGTSERSATETRVGLHISPNSVVRDKRDGRTVVIDILAPAPGAAAVPSPAAPQPPPPPAAEQPGLAHPPAPVAAQEPTSPPAASPASPAPDSRFATAAPCRYGRKNAGGAGGENRDPPRLGAAGRCRRVPPRRCAVGSVRPAVAARHGCAGGSGPRRRAARRPASGYRATVLRIETRGELRPHIERDGLAWIIRFSADRPPARQSIQPVADNGGNDGLRLLLPVAEPGEPLALDDPATGETMVVVPVIPLSALVDRRWLYPQFQLAETAQGIVVQPKIDTLRVRSLRDGVEISSSDGLALSVAAPPGAVERLLEGQDWTAPRGNSFVTQRQALERAVVDATTPAERKPARLRLAQFLLGRGFALEAIGILEMAAQQHPELATAPRFLLLRGAAQLLSGRIAGGRDDFRQALAAGGGDEVRLWAAAAQAAQGGPVAASELALLPAWTAVTLSYPPDLRAPVAAWLAEAAIAGGQLSDGQRFIDTGRPAATGAEVRAQFTYLEGRRKEAAGDVDGALAAYEATAKLDPRRGPGAGPSWRGRCCSSARTGSRRWRQQPRSTACATPGVATRSSSRCCASWDGCNCRPAITRPACGR